jgi:hypothetical protein
MPADDAVADTFARLEERIFQAGGLHVFDAATQGAIAGKIDYDTFASRLFILGWGRRLFSGRKMGGHCPSMC